MCGVKGVFHCEEIEQTYIIRKTVPFAQISKNDADEQFKTGVSIPKFVSSLALNFVTNLDRFAQSGRYLVEEGEIYKSLPKLTAPHTTEKHIFCAPTFACWIFFATSWRKVDHWQESRCLPDLPSQSGQNWIADGEG